MQNMNEIVVATRMMTNTERRRRERLLLYLSSVSEILMSACNTVLISKLIYVGETYFGTAILLVNVPAAEHTHGGLLCLGTVEARVPPAQGVHIARAVRGAQDH